jgi:minor extracellular serine protease Vpr
MKPSAGRALAGILLVLVAVAGRAAPVASGGTAAAPEVGAIVLLDGQTALDMYLARHLVVGDTSGKAQRILDAIYAHVAARQQPVRAFIAAAGARIVSTYDTGANGFLVHGTPAQIARLARAPGVRGVYGAPRFRPQLADAVPLVGGDVVRDKLGYSGRGVRIAIIDSGLDYTHRALGGRGDPAEFAANDPAVIEPGSFPTTKVVGGWDFGGDSYDAETGLMMPDPDPIDSYGHGTHVAGIAAGLPGVPGLYHGVAPDAELIALKTLGYSSADHPFTELVGDAVEWTIEANLGRDVPGECRPDPRGLCRVDVINMSLGVDYGGGIDVFEQFAAAATRAGIVVVASAGNQGDNPFAVGVPSAAPHALSVASSRPPVAWDKIEVAVDGVTRDVQAVPLPPELAEPIGERTVIRAALGCVPGEFYFCDSGAPAASVQGRIVLANLYYDVTQQLAALAEAGALGVVFAAYYDDPTEIRWEPVPGARPGPLPAYLIAAAEADRLIERVMSAQQVVEVTMSGRFRRAIALDYLTDTISSFSSRGPSISGSLKPDLAAPGSAIRAPFMGGGTAGVTHDGTSMASPMVAGGAAVLVQRARQLGWAPPGRPLGTPGGLQALDIAALLVNYASAPVWDGDRRSEVAAPLARAGAGRLALADAARGETLVRAGPIASVSFGLHPLADTYTETRPVTITNLAQAPRHYALAARVATERDAWDGVAFSLGRDDVILAPGASTTVTVTVTADPRGLASRPVDASDRIADALSDVEVDGRIVVTEVDAQGRPEPGGDVVSVPLYVVPWAAASVSAAAGPVRIDRATARGTLRLSNGGPGAGAGEVFARLAADPREVDLPPAVDVDLVGVRVEPSTGDYEMISFLLHTAGARTSAFETWPLVFIDVDRDGNMDQVLAGTYPSGGYLGATDPLRPGDGLARSGAGAPGTLDWIGAQITGVLGGRNIILSAPSQGLGFTPGQPIVFDAVVMHVSAIEGAVEDLSSALAGTAPADVVPDNGVEGGGFGTGRLTFDAGRQPFRFDPPRLAVTAHGGRSAAVRWLTFAPQRSSGLYVAAFPDNMPGDGDIQDLDIEFAEPIPVGPNTRYLSVVSSGGVW